MTQEKRLRKGRCIHCLAADVRVNDDHVLPQSWYPPGVVPSVAKWVAPSCIPCNNRLGAIENDLRIRFGYCVDPESPVTASFVEAALRATSPELMAGNEREAAFRRRLRDRLAGEALVSPPARRLLPSFPERWGRPPEEQVALPIRKDHLHAFVEKIVRGVHYLEAQRYIELPWVVEIYPLGDQVQNDVAPLLESATKIYEITPAIKVTLYCPNDAEDWSICSIEIWQGAMRFWACVSRASFPRFGTGPA